MSANLIHKALIGGECSAGRLAEKCAPCVDHADEVREALHRVVSQRKGDRYRNREAVHFGFRLIVICDIFIGVRRILLGVGDDGHIDLDIVLFGFRGGICSCRRSDCFSVVACIGKSVQNLLHDLGVAAVGETENRILAEGKEVDLVGAARNAEVLDLCTDDLCDLLRQCLALALFDIVLDFHNKTSVFPAAPCALCAWAAAFS